MTSRTILVGFSSLTGALETEDMLKGILVATVIRLAHLARDHTTVENNWLRTGFACVIDLNEADYQLREKNLPVFFVPCL